ncbi:cytochrome p450 [Colletotrichum kahawae]|uniref:Cytochrome p450 n=1 Tax=Colletotrichum kahawae TaxID=34407 RepID=A0AAE0DAF4_COLKA|nr:cytochrome p450 [Colletotrichum kahawae]
MAETLYQLPVQSLLLHWFNGRRMNKVLMGTFNDSAPKPLPNVFEPGPNVISKASASALMLALSCIIWVTIYRLYFSSIAKFPGPKLAALTGLKPYDKLKRSENRLGIPGATFSKARHELHKIRRAAISLSFAKSRSREQTGDIQTLMETFSRRLTSEYAGTGRVISTPSGGAALPPTTSWT